MDDVHNKGQRQRQDRWRCGQEGFKREMGGKNSSRVTGTATNTRRAPPLFVGGSYFQKKWQIVLLCGSGSSRWRCVYEGAGTADVSLTLSTMNSPVLEVTRNEERQRGRCTLYWFRVEESYTISETHRMWRSLHFLDLGLFTELFPPLKVFGKGKKIPSQVSVTGFDNTEYVPYAGS